MSERENAIDLNLDQLRAIAGWAADCAERALPVYEAFIGSDKRPREAIEGIRDFAAGGNRSAQLRKIALAALSAAREIGDPAAAAAARAACLAASSAYTHPLADVEQTKHIVGPAAYAALAMELSQGGNEGIGDAEVRWSIEHAPREAREVLVLMDARNVGKSRLDRLMYDLDREIRVRVD